MEFEFEDDGRTLVLIGLVADTISETGEPGPTEGDSILGKSSIIDLLPGWKSLARLHESSSGRKRDDMFWRTILLDMKVKGIHSASDPTSSTRHPQKLYSEEYFIPPDDPSEEAELLNNTRKLWKRRFFVTANEGMGIGPEKSVAGDAVCVLLGGEVPYVLRPLEDPGYYRLIGDCYMHDIMDGQAIEEERYGKYSYQKFKIR